jgi:hypothetical protein
MENSKSLIMARILFLVAIAVLLLGGCAQIYTPQKASLVSARLGEPFTLGIGQGAIITLESLTVKVLNLTDSRCPSDVQCIRAGEAAVMVQVVQNGKSIGTFNISTAAQSPKYVSGYAVLLSRVEPYPVSIQPRVPSDYAITLIVSKEPLNSLSQTQKEKISPELTNLINIKTHGLRSPDSSASSILSSSSITLVVEFYRELSPLEIQSLQNSGVNFESVNDQVVHTGKLYQVDAPWASLWKSLDKLTAMTDVAGVDTNWRPTLLTSTS